VSKESVTGIVGGEGTINDIECENKKGTYTSNRGKEGGVTLKSSKIRHFQSPTN